MSFILTDSDSDSPRWSEPEFSSTSEDSDSEDSEVMGVSKKTVKLLDQMDETIKQFAEWRKGGIFKYARIGNVLAVRHILGTGNVDVNASDEFDGTPLYYACLCGHLELVQYLIIEAGAVCNEATFHGERCIYGALTDEIRDFLKSEKVIHSCPTTRSKFYNDCVKLMKFTDFSDVKFVDETGKRIYELHKCVLLARSKRIRDILNEITDGEPVVLSQTFGSNNILKPFFEYIYTGRAELSHDDLTDLMTLANECELYCLAKQCEAEIASLNEGTRRSRRLRKKLERQKIILQAEESVEKLQSNLRFLGQLGIPENLQYLRAFSPSLTYSLTPHGWDLTSAGISFGDKNSAIFDFCLKSKTSTLFYCHKAILCARSEYFGAKILRYATELPLEETGIPVWDLSTISNEVLATILYHVYGEKISDFITIKSALDCLDYSELYLLPDLTHQCGLFIAKHLNLEIVFEALRAARLYRLERLDDECIQFLAKNFDKVLTNPEFRELVRSDAESIKDREAADSIIILDDLAFYLRSMPKYKTNKRKINALLKKLNLGVFHRVDSD